MPVLGFEPTTLVCCDVVVGLVGRSLISPSSNPSPNIVDTLGGIKF